MTCGKTLPDLRSDNEANNEVYLVETPVPWLILRNR